MGESGTEKSSGPVRGGHRRYVRGAPRLLLVAPFPPPPGGMAVQARALFDRLQAEGWRVSALPTNPPWPVPLRPLERVRGLRTAITAGLFLMRLAAAIGRVDLVHILSCSHLGFCLFTVPTVTAARLWRRPVMVNFRGGNAEPFFRRHPRALAWLRRADVLTVPSGFLRNVFARFGLGAVVVPNIAEVERFEFRRRDRLVPHLLVARNLEPCYNVALALRAFERIREERPEATLTIAGDGPERARLERMVARRRIPGVRFLGRVPNRCMPRIYERCDVALNPSNVDNMPISVLEAFAAGLPVVSTRVGGVPYIVEDGRTGFLVPPGDDRAMADRVLWLCRHPEEAAAAADRARRACQVYTWPAVRETLLAVYVNMLRRRGKPGR